MVLEYAVSVIIPIYNVEKFLPRCLDSVRNQSLKNIQIICVNDGCTDGCAAILSRFAQNDSRFQIITQENKGLSEARNSGLQAVKGRYVFFLDSDDYLHPQALEIFYKAAERSGLSVIISRKLFRIGKDKIEIKKYDDCNVPYKICKNPLKDLYAHRLISAVVWNKLYRADILKPFHFINGIYFEDWPYTTCLFSTLDSFAMIDEKLYIYNTTSPSIVRSSFSVKKIKDYIIGIRHVYQYLQTKEDSKAWLIVRKKRIASSLNMVLSKISKSTTNQQELECCFLNEYKNLANEHIIAFKDLSLKSKFRMLRILWHQHYNKNNFNA